MMRRNHSVTKAHSVTSARSITALARVVDAAMLAIVAIGLTSVVVGRLLPALGYPVYIVAGRSMEPALPVGAAVILEPAPPLATLAVGDVVTLRSGPERAVFTHRIIRVADHDGQTWIETKGDANATADPSITAASAVIGRVNVGLPYAGYLISLLSTVPGLVLVLSTGALLLVLGWWLDGLASDRRRPLPSATPTGARVWAP